MTIIYPVVFSVEDGFVLASVPDLGIDTGAETLTNAIASARDAIGTYAITAEDEGLALPAASELHRVQEENESKTVSLVDVDVGAYRRRYDTRTVRRNCTLPAWLDKAASDAKINVSAVLQNALKQELQLN